MYTSRLWLVGLTLAAISTLSTAQTQSPLTQQLNNNPPVPVQSQSYQLRPTTPAVAQTASPSPASTTGTPSTVAATPASTVQTVTTPAAAQAQPAPTTPVVRNQSAATANTSAPAAVPSRTYAPRVPIGDVTRTLLAIQASPNRSGVPHTVLGETATRSWNRYLRSFESDIPERFQQLEAQRSSR